MNDFELKPINKERFFNLVKSDTFINYKLTDHTNDNYIIESNNVNENNIKSSLQIFRNNEILLFGQEQKEKLDIFNLFNYASLDSSKILDFIKSIYLIAVKYNIYHPSKNKSHFSNALKRMNDKSILNLDSKFKTHFDVVGFSGTRRLNDFRIQRQYFMTEDFNITEYYRLSIPISAINELKIKFTFVDEQWKIIVTIYNNETDTYTTIKPNSIEDTLGTVESVLFKQYQSVILKYFEINPLVYDPVHVNLLRMIFI